MPCCSEPQFSGNGEKIRGCTDVFCLSIFVGFWFFMILIAAFAIVFGNPLRLINGYDSFGNTCGSSNTKFGRLDLSGVDLSDKPYVFFLNVENIKASMKICVKECPSKVLRTLEDILQFYDETGSMLCRYGFEFANSSMYPNGIEYSPEYTNSSVGQNDFDAVSESTNSSRDRNITFFSPFGPCPVMPVYKSSPILNRCIPKASKGLANEIVGNLIAYLNSQEVMEQVLSDLYATWKEILWLTIGAFAFSFLLILIIHLVAAIVSIILMGLVSVSVVVCTSILWWTYVSIKNELDATPQSQLLEESAKNERAFLIYSVLATVFTVLLLFLVLFMRKRLVNAVEVFRIASDCLSSLPVLFLQPLLTFVILLSFFIFWIFVVVCLATASTPDARSVQPWSTLGHSELSGAVLIPAGNLTEIRSSRRNATVSGSFTLIEFIDPAWVRYFWWVYLIGLVWTAEFILSCQQMVIAGAVALWYFNPCKPERLRDRIADSYSYTLSSASNLFLYHLGSVALGSFLITVFKIPRLIVSFLKREYGKYCGENVCINCCTKCCSCCLYFEKFLKYINHNAYTVIALEGVNFYPASKVAFESIMENAMQVAVINSVGDFLLFLGKCSVVAIIGLIGLLLMKLNPHLHLYAVPIFMICVFAYFIAHSVLSLYEMVIDTIILCVCEDSNLANGNDDVLLHKKLVSQLLHKEIDCQGPERVIPGQEHTSAEENESILS